MPRGKLFTIKSMVGARTGQPAVSFRMGDQHVNMPLVDARTVALQILGASDRAELEARLVAFMRGQGADEPLIGQALELLRAADEAGQQAAGQDGPP